MVAAASAIRKAAARGRGTRRARFIRLLLEELRRQIGPMDRDMARSAVAIPRQRDVVERRGLGAEGIRLDPRVAFEAQLVDIRALQHLGVRRAVLLVAAQAVLGRDGGEAGRMLEDERAALLRVTVQARRLAGPRQAKALLARAAVRVVAGHAVHDAVDGPMR